MSTESEFLNIIYVDEVCRMFLFVLHRTVSPLHELPKPRSTPNTLTPLLHTSLQRVCFGNFHVLTNNSPSEINHSCTQREILCTHCDDKMKHVWSKPCVPACPELCYLLKEHVPNVFGFCYPLWLQRSLSFGIYDFRSDRSDWLNRTFLECEAWGIHRAASLCSRFQASLASISAPGVWGILGDWSSFPFGTPDKWLIWMTWIHHDLKVIPFINHVIREKILSGDGVRQCPFRKELFCGSFLQGTQGTRPDLPLNLTAYLLRREAAVLPVPSL